MISRNSPVNRKIFASLLIIVMLSIVVISCRHEAVNLESQPHVCFNPVILNIFRTSCAQSGCHDGKDESGYDFTNYEGILESIVPGSPEKSRTYQAITSYWGETSMPPGQPLSERNRTLIRLWIEQGAENFDCADTMNSVGSFGAARACYQRDVAPILQSSCAIPGCHDSATRVHGVQLDSLSEVMKQVVPGHPDYSWLYLYIIGRGTDLMPPDPYPPLTVAQEDTIRNWILYGALNEYCGENCDTLTFPGFQTSISPIIQNNCLGCHSGILAQDGFRLENYNEVRSAAISGKLMGAINGKTGYAFMPPSGALTDCQIRMIRKWIQGGSQNN